MSKPETRADGRILGMRKGRPETAVVQSWVPPTQAEVGEIPSPQVYPSCGMAHSVLEQGTAKTEAEQALAENAEAVARKKLAQAQNERMLRIQARATDILACARKDREDAEKMLAGAQEGEADIGARPESAPTPDVEEEGRAQAEAAGGYAPKHSGTPQEKASIRVQQMVRERPEDAAKLVRTMLMEEISGGTESGQEEAKEADFPPVDEELALMQKVAITMVGLGEETAGEVMKYLSDYEIEEITQAVTGMKSVSAEFIDCVLVEFEQHLLGGEWVSQGGADFARAALERAVGPRKAQEILDRICNRVSSGFYMLKNVAADQIAPFISHEHPQTIALILSQLDANQAGGILANLPVRMQADVGYRIATMEKITPNVIKQIEESLESSLRDMLAGNQDVGGPKVIADMLNCTGRSVEKNVLDQMDGQDPEAAEVVRNLMFVFADIAKLTDREIQAVLTQVDQKDLVVALKGASDELKDKMLGNMSEKVRKFISEEMEFLGPMRLSEVEEVQLRIVQQVRLLEEKGQVTIVRGDADDQFI